MCAERHDARHDALCDARHDALCDALCEGVCDALCARPLCLDECGRAFEVPRPNIQPQLNGSLAVCDLDGRETGPQAVWGVARLDECLGECRGERCAVVHLKPIDPVSDLPWSSRPAGGAAAKRHRCFFAIRAR